jgi:hypothetical protein
MLLSELAGKHRGETIWVLGSGPSLTFLSSSFFLHKITVSTNFSARALGVKPDYVFSNYHEDALDLLTDSGIVVTLAKNWRDDSPFPSPDKSGIVLIEQDSYRPKDTTWNPLTTHRPREDSLAFGSSSLHGAMHLAAHLGASHIVLVGADCGTIDGHDRIADYAPASYGPGATPWEMYNKHHKLMKEYLVEKYGVQVYSLNPFINFNLEGHTFHGAS